MEEGKQQMQQALQQMPQEMLECLNSELGSDVVEKLKAERRCFQKIWETKWVFADRKWVLSREKPA